jgi:hypothetical protein
MSGRVIHIMFDLEGRREIFFEADSDKETDWLQEWLRQNFIGARSSDSCGDSLQIPGAPSLCREGEKNEKRLGQGLSKTS